MTAKYAPLLAWPSSDFKPGLARAAATDSTDGSLPFCLKVARTAFVLSFDSCTLGWSKASMPRTAPAMAVATSQRKNSPEVELVPHRERYDRLARLFQSLLGTIRRVVVHAAVDEQ